MSEPVVWMQSDHLAKFKYQACGSQSMLVRCSDYKSQSDFKPLYDTDAIAELIGILKIAEEFVDRHSEAWYISGQRDLAEIRTVIGKYDDLSQL